MSIEDYIRFAAALIFVLSLMALIGWVMRRINGANQGFAVKDKRLSIIEQKMIDPRNKMVLIRRDNKEHLVILSQNGNTVIETGIETPAVTEGATIASVPMVRSKKDIRLESL